MSNRYGRDCDCSRYEYCAECKPPSRCLFPRCDCPDVCLPRMIADGQRAIAEAEAELRDLDALFVPNRLYGATINHEGDAV